jgi:hypothetical protein
MKLIDNTTDTKYQGGLYVIVCLVNNKKYGGACTDFSSRKGKHVYRLRRNLPEANKNVQADFDKYGEDEFVFMIMERCHESELVSIEQKWLDENHDDQKECYNISKIATRGMLRMRPNVLLDGFSYLSPQGIVHTINSTTNLAALAREHNVRKVIFYELFHGTSKSAKGWTLFAKKA